MGGLPEPVPHMTATFSPDTYDVQSEVVLSQDEELCSPVSGRYMKGKIVLAIRGNCTFIEKAMNAEMAGALALIVGNYLDRKAELIRMGVALDYPIQSLSMPSVFIRGTDYAAAVEVVRNRTKSPNGNSVQARLNAVGLVIDPTINQLSSLQLVAFLLLLLPLIWCLVACAFCLRKSCMEAINHYRRTRRMATMPVIQFQSSAVDRAGAGTQVLAQGDPSARIHNDSCAICLDDFTESEPVQLLPCGHGYHPSCVHPWLARSDLCPICKTSILSDSSSSTRGHALPIAQRATSPPTAIAVAVDSPHLMQSQPAAAQSPVGGGDAMDIPLIPLGARSSISTSDSSSSSAAVEMEDLSSGHHIALNIGGKDGGGGNNSNRGTSASATASSDGYTRLSRDEI